MTTHTIQKRWKIAPIINSDSVSFLSESLNVSAFISQLLHPKNHTKLPIYQDHDIPTFSNNVPIGNR